MVLINGVNTAVKKPRKIKSNLEELKSRNAELIIDYYTDPLCCWSWAFEPQLRKLRYQYLEIIHWRNRMVGMLPDWDTYNDPMNNVYRPAQMGPVWAETKHKSGMPFNERLWFENPPQSSYPACLAVKTAEMFNDDLSEIFLRKMREAVMVQGKDISNKEVILQIAKQIEKENDIDYEQFKISFLNKEAVGLLKEDLDRVKLKNISRYPSLTIQAEDKRGIILTGYRPYEVLEEAISQMLPDDFIKRDIDPDEYRSYWGNITEREMEEVMETEMK